MSEGGREREREREVGSEGEEGRKGGREREREVGSEGGREGVLRAGPWDGSGHIAI